MEVSVVIPARDAGATLPATLSALDAQQGAPTYEVIVIDDAAGEGPAAARNRGAARATGRLLAFTDADCEPEPGWLAALAAAARDADVVQGRVVPAGPVGPFDRTISVEVMHGLFETANLAIRRDLFERLGGFESILRPRRGKELGEDVWLGWRARRAGARVEFCPEAVVRHAVFPRSGAEYVAERARLRHFPALVARVPELRDAFLHRGVFLSARTARFDLALAGVAAAAATRRPWPLVAALPYARRVRADGSGAWGVAADTVGAAALAAGSVRHRTPVL